MHAVPRTFRAAAMSSTPLRRSARLAAASSPRAAASAAASSAYRDPTTVVLRTADDAKVPFETIRLSAVESASSKVRPTHVHARVVVVCAASRRAHPRRAYVSPA